jgi:hypothetical protein
MTWSPSDSLQQAIIPDIFVIDDGRIEHTTTCRLISACESSNPVLPEDTRLLTCEVMYLFPQYAPMAQRPLIKQTDFYVVPPYDAVPGIQNTMKRNAIVTEKGAAFTQLPTPRDLVDY